MAGCDSTDVAEELCESPELLKRLSKNGVLALACATYVGLSRITTNHLRITLMLLFAWMICKDILELEVQDAVLVVVHVLGALHLVVLPKPAGVVMVAFAAFAYADRTYGMLGEGVLLSYLTGALLLAAAYRTYQLAWTVVATATLTNIFPLVSKVFPSFTFSDEYFFRADGCPPDIAAKRKESFNALKDSWDAKWPESKEQALFLKEHFSDLRFASGSRVFLPFNRLLDDNFDPATIVVRSDKTDLIDIDGQRMVDISGSYGVNVIGTDRYKKMMEAGLEQVKDLGLVLGPIHPLVKDNIEMLTEISGKDEVSFHMSGTEAVMAAVRLCRYNTGRKLIVVFGGSYHGWWDGVQTSAGNERGAFDVLTLNDMSPASLRVIALRASEIACVIVNPLQAFHPNKPPPSDLVLMSNSRDAGKKENAYKAWLQKLKATCRKAGVVFMYDEVYTGFRLAKGGAQEYYDVAADIVVYGKTLGGGMPIGVVCGPAWLMNRNDVKKPLRVAYVIGTFSAAPLTVACMNQFLTWLGTDDATKAYRDSGKLVQDWMVEMNAALEKEDLPLRVSSYRTVWTMLFTQPGRYHWFLQYLLRDEGVQLSWVGTGRLNFSLDFNKADLKKLKTKMLKACKRMRDEGWWWTPEDKKAFAKTIKARTFLEISRGFLSAALLGKKAWIR